MVHFGVISAYPQEDWHSVRIAQACAAAGTVDVLPPTAFGLRTGREGVTVRAAGRDVRAWDVWLLPRALGDAGDVDFQCMLYRCIGELGVPMVNPVTALLAAEDKIRSSWLLAAAGVPTPPVTAVQSLDDGLRALEELRVAVVKPPYGSLGIGILRLSRWDRDARRVLSRFLGEHGLVHLQKLVRSRRRRRDLRLFVVGAEVPGALEREAPPGEFRTNVHQGGQPRAVTPARDAVDVALRAARTLGLEYAGVDLMDTEDGPVVIEVNGTPRWEGILAATGRDMAHDIVAHAATLRGAGGHAPGAAARFQEGGEGNRWQTRARAS